MKGSTKKAPATLVARLLDQRDEHLARMRRMQLGVSLKLVSWYPLPDGRWLARLSGPEPLETTEEEGDTRCEAIELAENIHRRASCAYRRAALASMSEEP